MPLRVRFPSPARDGARSRLQGRPRAGPSGRRWRGAGHRPQDLADPRESRRGEAGAGRSPVHPPPPILSPYFSSPLSVLFSLSKHVFSRSPFSPDSRLLSLSFRLSTPLLPQVPFFSLSSNLDRAVVGCAPEVLVPSQTTPKLSNGGTPAGRSKDPAGKAASRHWSFPLSSAPAPSCQLSTSPV